jgi:hypothetical protein
MREYLSRSLCSPRFIERELKTKTTLRLEVIIDRKFAIIENSPQPVLKALFKGQLQTWSADISTLGTRSCEMLAEV